MKITLKILLLTLTILTLASCSAKKTTNQKFSLKIGALQTGLSLNGGSFVRAINGSINTLIKLDANDSAEFEHGTWEFQTVSFEGPGAYAGRRFCGRAVGVKLSDTQKDIALTITEANCTAEPFLSLMAAISANLNTGNFLTISEITPKGGPLAGGTSVTIIGSGFADGVSVMIGGKSCSSVNVVNIYTINCLVPSSVAGAVNVSVTRPDGQTTSAANFYTYRPSPVINSLAPATGAVVGGTNVTLTGTGFVAGATVMFGTASCIAPIVTSSTTLTCTTPGYPSGAINVVVTNPDGQMSGPSIFTYMPRPILISASPNNAPISGGTIVTFQGTGLENVQSIAFDGVLCSNLVNPGSSTSVTCTTPVHSAGPSVITVISTDGQSSTFSSGFIFNLPPTLSSININSGPLSGGTTVTIHGDGFMNGASVDFDGVQCGTVTIINANTLTCITPSHSSGPKTVTVINPDTQSGNAPGMFTYRQSFVSTWTIATANETITLPLVSGLNYDFMVDWGDGSAKDKITSFSSPLKTHTYTVPGNYTITINGLLEGWSFGGTADSKLKIIAVDNFGDMGWKNLNMAFYGCTNLTSFSGGVTNNVTNMSGMFKNASSLTTLNLSSFNTSNVTNMSTMFYGVSTLTSLSLSNFNTSNVTNMSYMFYAMEAVTSLNVAGFNTSMVTTMANMFGHTNVLPTLNVSSFNTANVLDMSFMFEQAMALTTLNLSNFDTSKVINMANMFNNAAALTTLDVSSFNTSNVTNMFQMFANMRAIPNLNLASFNTSKVTNMGSMFYGDDDLTSLNLSGFDTSLVTNMSSMFHSTLALGSLNVTNWNIGAVSNSADIFTNKNPSLVLTCNQGGSPATGTFFTLQCY